MANCTTCKYSWIEDIWYELDCLKSQTLNIDEDGFLQKFTHEKS